MITDDHIDYIIESIGESNLSNMSLRDDLIDHLCCVVESKMSCGLSFEEAYSEAKQRTCPNGCKEIERETFLLLNYKKAIIMKKLTYFVGFLFTFILMFGIFARILKQETPAPELFILIGGSGIVLFFLPLLFIKFEERIKTLFTKWSAKFAAIGFLFFVSSAWFKFMHWPGGSELLGFSMLFVIFGFLPFFFVNLYKSSLEKIQETDNQ